MNVPHCHWIEPGAVFLKVPGRPAWEGPVGLGFCPVLLNFGTPAPAIRTHPKLVELVRNKHWSKAHFIPEKLMARM